MRELRGEAGDEQVVVAVLVVVEQGGGEAHARVFHAGALGAVDEREVALVLVHAVLVGHQAHVQVGVAVLVEVVPDGAFDEAGRRRAGGLADVGERAVAVVVVEAGRNADLPRVGSWRSRPK